MKLSLLLVLLSSFAFASPQLPFKYQDQYLDCVDYGHSPVSKELDRECKKEVLDSMLNSLNDTDKFDAQERCLGMHGPNEHSTTLDKQLACVASYL